MPQAKAVDTATALVVKIGRPVTRSMGTRVERHIAMQPLELRTVLSRAAWHPDMADWAIMWEAVLYFRRRWIEYYLSKIQNDSRMMREEICSPKR